MEGVGQGYAPPVVRDYGDLVALTEANATMLHVGIGTGVGINAVSTPTTPGGGAGGGNTGGSTDTPVGETLPATGGEGSTPGGGAGGGSLGAAAGGGSGGSGGGGSGGGSGGSGGDLPFTGFAVAVIGALGSGMTAAGLALRRAVSRGRSPR
jgi:hypothetical protein